MFWWGILDQRIWRTRQTKEKKQVHGYSSKDVATRKISVSTHWQSNQHSPHYYSASSLSVNGAACRIVMGKEQTVSWDQV
jgi:hypothetical protein